MKICLNFRTWGYIFFLVIQTQSANAQCLFDDVFPFKHGMTKFQVINSISNNKLIYEKENSRSRYNMDEWFKPDYLNNDSIRISRIYCVYDNQCFSGYDSRLTLIFADDKLYNICFNVKYPKDSFKRVMIDYQMIGNILLKKFPFFEHSVTINNRTNSQIGEANKYYTTSKYDSSKTAIKLSYELNNFDEYEIQVYYYNFTGTKVKSSSFY